MSPNTLPGDADPSDLAWEYDRGLEQDVAAEPGLTDDERETIRDWHIAARTVAPSNPAVWELAETVLNAFDALRAARDRGALDAATYREWGATLFSAHSGEVYLAVFKLQRSRSVAWEYVRRRRVGGNA